MTTIILIALLAVVTIVAIVLIVRLQARLDVQRQLVAHEKELREQEAASASQRLTDAKDGYERSLKEIRDGQEKLLEATKAQLIVENEKTLKAREEALKKEAEQTMKSLTGGLNQQIVSMKEAFEAQKKAHTDETASIKTQFEETVKHLRAQTDAIGTQAGDLARALKGQNKMQGIFGETLLENLLIQEGLQKGRDYDSEFWLRDRKGQIIENEGSGHRMRPDFALHFPDGTDILLDAKVSLSALAEYFEADTPEDRAAASRRNLESVRQHIAELVSKEYQKYVQGRKTLDYVIMYIPNYGAYQLAKAEDPNIFSEAFRQNVLITTEETLIPFLRLIRSAWVQKAQMENMAEIVNAASKMVDRVSLFCEKNAELENQLKRTVRLFDENTHRLIDSPQSIVRAAKDVIKSGVSLSAGKALPEPTTLLDDEKVPRDE